MKQRSAEETARRDAHTQRWRGVEDSANAQDRDEMRDAVDRAGAPDVTELVRTEVRRQVRRQVRRALIEYHTAMLRALARG